MELIKKRNISLKRTIWYIILSLMICGLLILTFSEIWAKRYYGSIGFEEIVFHLKMPLQGTSQGVLKSYAKNCILPTVICMVGWCVLHIPYRNYKIRLKLEAGKKIFCAQLYPLKFTLKMWITIITTWMLVIILLANIFWDFGGYLVNQFEQSKLIEHEYVNPKNTEIKFGKEKRNLICIYLESGETSAQDLENGGNFEDNYISELTELAKNNISFSQSELIEGASIAPACGWTIAGLVAETAGIPLKLSSYNEATVDNSMGQYEFFLPGATSLGDILEDAGYKNYFMAGSDFEFGGRTNYFMQHGNYEIWDYYSAIEEGKISDDYYVWWGFEDLKLYSYAKEKLVELAKTDQPFNFSMLTVDTHHEDGYVCELCSNKYDSQYANVWACASKQLDEFVNWIKEQDFYENTTIVILGDHCSMDTDFYEQLEYDKHTGETKRKVYNVFINSAVDATFEKNRKFTTMDMYPTILASLGVEIEGNKLGLGTNLFSGEKTLAEKYGYEELFEELNKKSSFYNDKILYP